MMKKIKYQLLPAVCGYFVKVILRLISLTCRYEVHGLDEFKERAKNGKCILMLWHNRLALVAEILRKFAPEFMYAAFISKSRDGELLAVIAESYTFGKTIRVPHDARFKALRSMIQHLKNGSETVIITPDGPRGPRYEVKPGITLAAKETSAAIVPLSWTPTCFWQFSSWDRLIIPKPFSKVVVHFGHAIFLHKDSTGNLEEDSTLLQKSLNQLEQETCRKLFKDEREQPK